MMKYSQNSDDSDEENSELRKQPQGHTFMD